MEEARIKILKDSKKNHGQYILYWMQGSQRSVHNYSLEYSIKLANENNLPLIVCFNIVDNYKEANERHYYFMVEGLLEVKENLLKRGIEFYLVYGDPLNNITKLSKKALKVVVDKGYLKWQRDIQEKFVKNIDMEVVSVEGNIIVPIEVTSEKEEYAARTIRPKIKKNLEKYLYDFKFVDYLVEDRLDKEILDIKEIEIIEDRAKAIINKLKLNRDVKRSKFFKGGESEGIKRLNDFIEKKLKSYSEDSSKPDMENISSLSPYLHFGQISPHTIALKALEKKEKSKGSVDDFLEELIIRRELAFNFVYYNNNYDNWDGITYPWAYESLKLHEGDKREYLYSLKDLEEANTHDVYWNTCMKEMVYTGFMHGYMRMYWAKKILEWSKTPREAFERTLMLNNKYFIDGRDPNSYTGVAWCYGKHDRAWKEREVYGKIRTMTSSGLERKFNMKKYIERIEYILEEVEIG